MLVRNISGTIFEVIGITFAVDEVMMLDDFGTRDQLRMNTSKIMDAVGNNKLQFEYTDGYVQTDTAKLYNLLINGFAEVQVTNKVETEKKLNNYYFIKDDFKIRKDDIYEKEFRGRVKTLVIMPQDRDVDIVVITGDGVRLPAERLIKHKTIEYNFDGDVKDIIIEFTGLGTNRIDVFIEGFNTDATLPELQNFVDTSYYDKDEWITSSLAIAYMWNDNEIVYSYTNDNVNGNKFTINDDKTTYKIYKVATDDYMVEFLTNGTWCPFRGDRFYTRIKNVRYFEFNDVTVDVTVDSIADVSEHNTDKEVH